MSVVLDRTLGARAMDRLLVTLTVAIVALLGMSGSAGAAAWLPPVDVSAPQTSTGCGFFCTLPGAAGVDVAVDGQGNAVAAWTRRSDASVQTVQAAFRPAGGSFGAPQDIGTTQTYFLGIFGPLADIAMDSAGNAVLVWPTTKNGKTVVQSAVRPTGGSFGAPVDLTADDQTALNDPRVAMSASGDALAVWTRSNGTHNIVQASRKPPGGSFGPPTNLSVSGQSASTARVAMNDEGAAAVTWVRSNGSHTIAQGRIRPAGGGAFAAVQDLSATGQNASSPEVAIEGSGRSTFVWQRPDGTRTRIQSRFMTPAGAPGAGVDDVSNDDRNGSAPQVALDPDNNAVALWIGCPAGGGGSCVIESAARPSNGSFGSVDSISPPGDSNSFPDIAVDRSGNAMAAWSDFGGARIRASRRPRGGGFGAVEDISPSPGSAFLPSVVADDQGNVIAGWAFSRPAPDSRQVAQVAAFDAAPPGLSDISVPGSATTGASVPMSAGATDRWSGATVAWNFGDGGTGAGGSVAHSYGAPGAYTVTVTATDGAGNASSTTRTVQVTNAPPQPVPSPPPPPPPPPGGGGPVVEPDPTPIQVLFGFAFSKSTKRFTRFTLLQVKAIPVRSLLKVTCKGPKGKRKCPGGKRFTKKNAFGRVNLKKWRKKKLRAGTKLTARVTKPGNFIGAVKILTVRKKKAPKITTRCVLPGSSKAVRCQ